MTATERKAFIEAIGKREDLSLSQKRRMLLEVGVRTEYLPYSGKREIARRIKNMALETKV